MTNDEMDPRLARLCEAIREHLQCPVAIEDDKVVAGNFAILSINPSNNKVAASFHRECHPLLATTITIILISSVGSEDTEFLECFIADVRGVLTFESEAGFDLVHIQYLRDLLGTSQKKVFSS